MCYKQSSTPSPKTHTHLWHCWHEVAAGRLELVDDGVGWHGSHASDALHILVGQVGFAFLLALGQGHIEGFGAHNAPIHLSHRLGGLLRGGETHKTEPLGTALLQHDLHIDTSDSHMVL